ncbi:MAG TPA: hypothetical protein VFU15_04605 [Bacteroidia bacterium]|nr:hypothetical protein [Bacteroidia bacterium]
MLRIDNPCSESWEKMTPAEQGRFCDKCSLGVIDFTQKSQEEIIAFIRNRNGQRTCGRFRRSQLAPVKFRWRMQKFAAAALLVFGAFLFSSCGNKNDGDGHVMGDVPYQPDDSTRMAIEKKAIADSRRSADSVAKVQNDADRNNTVYHLSSADSAKAADSAARSRNGVRDFK